MLSPSSERTWRTAASVSSFGDYAATVFGFLGLATPNFLLALILMYLAFTYFGWSPGGRHPDDDTSPATCCPAS